METDFEMFNRLLALARDIRDAKHKFKLACQAIDAMRELQLPVPQALGERYDAYQNALYKLNEAKQNEEFDFLKIMKHVL